MSNNETKPAAQPARSASQRIEDLEKGLMSMYQAFDGVAQDLSLAKDALKLLSNRVASLQSVVVAGDSPTEDNVNKAMIANNVKELEQKVDSLKEQGVLTTSDLVTKNTFVVGRELDDAGNVVNPRLQFALAALQPEVQAKIKDNVVGSVVSIQEGKLKFEILEIYSINPPKAPEAPAAEAPAAEAAPAATPDAAPAADAPAAPAAVEGSSAQ